MVRSPQFRSSTERPESCSCPRVSSTYLEDAMKSQFWLPAAACLVALLSEGCASGPAEDHEQGDQAVTHQAAAEQQTGTRQLVLESPAGAEGRELGIEQW